MELDQTATADLAVFFSKRFPEPDQREALARIARIRFQGIPEGTADSDGEASWHALLSAASERRALKFPRWPDLLV